MLPPPPPASSSSIRAGERVSLNPSQAEGQQHHKRMHLTSTSIAKATGGCTILPWLIIINDVIKVIKVVKSREKQSKK